MQVNSEGLSEESIASTTCSKDLTALGDKQKVLAFTVYGGATFDSFKRDYFAGVEQNLKAIKKLYPSEYRMRLYYDVPKNGSLFRRLCNLACNETRLDICDVTRNPMFGNIR